MPIPPQQTTYYKQVRFTTRLPNHYKYSPSHYWIHEISEQQFRVGFTKFAARMLGDFVEVTFSVNCGEQVSTGNAIGTVEGFKAVSDVYCVGDGEWLQSNSEIERQPDLVDKDSYDRGWLYEISGQPSEEWLTVEQYIALLDATIGKMLESEQQAKEPPC